MDIRGALEKVTVLKVGVFSFFNVFHLYGRRSENNKTEFLSLEQYDVLLYCTLPFISDKKGWTCRRH
jgi:hypothetical protein